jgi:hypothetical protein
MVSVSGSVVNQNALATPNTDLLFSSKLRLSALRFRLRDAGTGAADGAVGLVSTTSSGSLSSL